MSEKISLEELQRHYENCRKHTPDWPVTSFEFELRRGFMLGFRFYETIATLVGKAVTEDESKNIQPVEGNSTGRSEL